MEAISVSRLNKSYFVPVRKTGFMGGLRTLLSMEKREVRAVKDVSFQIAPGEFVGYIGPNGAGKSTTVKMLVGILHPTSGVILVNGKAPYRQRERLAREIGVVFGQRTQLWWDLPTRDSFDILAAMYDLRPSEYKAFLQEFDDLLELGRFLDTPVRRLSLGQRMRAELAASLIHRPKVLFLDEPTIGLDLIAKGRIREFLTRVNRERGVTILLTSHDLRDIEELCDRVLVLSSGSLIYDGALRSLRDEAGLPTLLTVEYAPCLRESSQGCMWGQSAISCATQPALGVLGKSSPPTDRPGRCRCASTGRSRPLPRSFSPCRGWARSKMSLSTNLSSRTSSEGF